MLLVGRFWVGSEVLGLTMVTGGICEVDMIAGIYLITVGDFYYPFAFEVGELVTMQIE